jgi:hypothetical protein
MKFYKKTLIKDLRILFYYNSKKTGDYRVLDTSQFDKEKYEYDYLITTMTYKELIPLDNRFEMFDGYSQTDAELRRYRDDFQEWSKVLRANDTGVTVNYKVYYNHNEAVSQIFKCFCKGKYEHHEKINRDEVKQFKQNRNGGLEYCGEPGTYDSYAYDYTSFFPRLMADKKFKIPTKAGEHKLLKKLPKRNKIEYGFYRVKITSNDNDVRKCLAYSPNNTYTHITLKFAIKLSKRFDINFELIQDGETNAYIYNKEDLVTGNEIFGDWFEKLSVLKTEYPKNRLVKHLLSSLWGHLSQAKELNKTEQELIDGKYDWGCTDEYEWEIIDYVELSNRSYYKLCNTKNTYKYNIRLMPFLHAYSRNEIAKIALKDIDNVIRIHTDCVVFKKDPNFDIPGLLREAKSSGKIKWVSAREYYHECPKCKTEYTNKEGHTC